MELPPILKTPTLLARSDDIIFPIHSKFVKYYGTGLIEILFTGDNNNLLTGKSNRNYKVWCSLALYAPILISISASIISNNWWLMLGIVTALIAMGITKKGKIVVWVAGAVFVFVFYKSGYNVFNTPSFLLLIFIINYWVSNWADLYKDTEIIKRLISDADFYHEMIINYKVVVFRTNKTI